MESMESNIRTNDQMLGNADEIAMKAEMPPNHNLGLHDLYKAAFGQADGFSEEHSLNPQLMTEGTFDGKLESTVDKTGLDETYQLYTIKNVSDEKDEIKVSILNFPGDGVKVSEATPGLLQRPFESYQTIDTNSVLDLDKGIQIQVIKAGDPGDNSPNLGYYENREYAGDSQILQRYLNDAAFMKNDDASSVPIVPLTFVDKPFAADNNKSYLDDRGVGVSPEALGVRFEDCEFNSSDSFASIESIIPKNIKCPKCPKKFMFKSDLLRHDKYKHSVKLKLSCKFCNKDFASQQNLLFHERSHKKKSPNKCEVCNKVFKKLGFLVKHMMKKHSKSASHVCVQCEKVFASQNLLNNHMKKVHSGVDGSKPFKCEICSKSFEKKQGLSCHVKAHTDEHIYECEVCSKAFTKICYLKNHQKCHANEEKEGHPCEVCGKDFKSLNALEEHSRKHTGEKPFTCNVCLKSFSYKAYYKLHIKKHSEIQPYSCNYCQKTFITSADLNKHERSHTKEKPFHCTNCNQDFSQQSNLITHWKKQRCNGGKTQENGTQTQENGTQTQEFAYIDPNVQNIQNLSLQNVNLLVDQSAFNQQPIVLTSIGSFISPNAVPVILAQSPAIPYTISSITS